MYSLSALKWLVNLYVWYITEKKIYFCVGACTADNVSGHAFLSSWHDICVRFSWTRNHRYVIDKYAFYCGRPRLLNRRRMIGATSEYPSTYASHATVNLFLSCSSFLGGANTTSTTARTTSENVTSHFCNHLSIMPSQYSPKMCSTYPGIILEPALQKTKWNICHHMLTSSTQLQNRSFHVVERKRKSANVQK